MNKKSKRLLVMMALSLGLVAVGATFGGVKSISFVGRTPVLAGQSGTVSRLSTEYFSSLSVNLTNVAVKVVGGDTFKVNYYGSLENKPTVKVEGSKLVISQNKSRGNVFSLADFFANRHRFVQKKVQDSVVITVPTQKEMKTANFTLNNSSLTLKSMDANRLTISIDDADVVTHDLTARNLVLSGNNSDVSLRGGLIRGGRISATNVDYLVRDSKLTNVTTKLTKAIVFYRNVTLTGGSLTTDGDVYGNRVNVQKTTRIKSSGDVVILAAKVGGYVMEGQKNRAGAKASLSGKLTFNKKSTKKLIIDSKGNNQLMQFKAPKKTSSK